MLSPRRSRNPHNNEAGDILRAVKHTYDVETERWRKEECRIILADKPFAEGGMRMCIKMHITLTKHSGNEPENFAAGVAKIFKPNILPKHVVCFPSTLDTNHHVMLIHGLVVAASSQ